jgi:hypothetical protein
MHFGLIRKNGRFFKKARNDDGTETGAPRPLDGTDSGAPVPINSSWQSDADARVIDMAKLAATLAKDGKPAQFAMTMIEGIPRVIFEVR